MTLKEDCFHLGVKALIRNEEGRLLLLKKERSIKETYWDIPGGRIQKGETLLETLQRELEEEIGLKNIEGAVAHSMYLTNIRISVTDSDVGLIFSVYKYDVNFDFKPLLGDEHIDFDWFSINDAIGLLEPQFPPQLIKDLKSLEKN